MTLKQIFGYYIARYIYRKGKRLCEGLFYLYKQRKYKNIEKKLLGKVNKNRKITVSFLCVYSSIWKYDELFQLMLNSAFFDPFIVICPVVNKGKKHMYEEMEKLKSYFDKKKYPYVETYNSTKDIFISRKEIEADIVFYTNPYKGLIHNKYYIDKLSNSLPCYVPYAFFSVEGDWVFNLPFHNLCWKIFSETTMHIELAKKYQRLKALNMVCSGYPGCDVFLDDEYIPSNPWGNSSEKCIRIIWAPHHLKFQNFIYYSEYFFNLPLRRANVIVCFKPHPLLKQKLYEIWGVQITNQYYNSWNNNDGLHLFNEGDYVDLFLTSDTLIHDCGSFIFEYLFTNKPCLFLDSKESELEDYSFVGNLALEQHYHASSINEVDEYLNKVLVLGDDYMQNSRYEKLMNNFYPRNGSASKNIYNYLTDLFRG